LLIAGSLAQPNRCDFLLFRPSSAPDFDDTFRLDPLNFFFGFGSFKFFFELGSFKLIARLATYSVFRWHASSNQVNS
jgi:hypothetical protein